QRQWLKENSSVANLSFLPILVGVPLASLLTLLYGSLAGKDVRSQPHLVLSIWVYALAAIIELLAEPMHNVQKTSGALALLAFALGQLSHSVSLVTKYVYGIRSLLPWPPSPTKENTTPFLERTLLRISLSMTAQSIVKHFLTEWDKLMLSWFSPLQDQGGSLIARTGFQPIEEKLRVFFSRTLSSSKEPRTEELKTASCAIIFLSSAPTVLRAWIYYLPFLALNGGLAAFVSSVANPKDLAKQSRYMACFSALYTAIAVAFYRFTSLGDTSLAYANIINFTTRIGYCIHFTNMYYSKLHHRHLVSWAETLPPLPFALVTLLSGALLRTLVDVPVPSTGLALLLWKDVISSTSRALLIPKALRS
ncbi:hypothetical protein M378DRAFT_166882, partial [Amanita muscaria Koide BX008]